MYLCNNLNGSFIKKDAAHYCIVELFGLKDFKDIIHEQQIPATLFSNLWPRTTCGKHLLVLETFL